MQAYKLRVGDYQRLLDRGWRRSGSYCYHPINATTCCPNYPISCKALEFKISRSQRRCIENLNSFLLVGREKSGERPLINYTNIGSDPSDSQSTGATSCDIVKQSRLPTRPFEELKASPKAREKRFVKSCELKMRLHNKTLDEAISMVKQRWTSMQQHRQSKCQPFKPSLEQLLYPKSATNQQSPKPKHRLEIHMKHVESAESEALRDEELLLMQAYQTAVHHENGQEKWDMSRYCDFLVNSPLITEHIDDRDYSMQSFSEQPGDNYSVKDYTDASDFFLVKPPDLPTVFGTYHCTYHLDDKLIAVGALDILPKCVTTLYFFYDPNYSYLNLGIYSALIEISMVRRIAAHHNSSTGKPNKLIYYYMGFYVHECLKMRYKTTFKPSYLLCSEARKYIPIEQCLKKLVNQKYARFSDEPEPTTSATWWTPSFEDILKIPVLAPVLPNNERKMAHYLSWLSHALGVCYVDIFINNFLIPYVKLVGKSLLPDLTIRVNSVHKALTERHSLLSSVAARRSRSTAAAAASTTDEASSPVDDNDEPTTADNSAPTESGSSSSANKF